MRSASTVLTALVLLLGGCGVDVLNQRSRPVSPVLPVAAGDPAGQAAGDPAATGDERAVDPGGDASGADVDGGPLPGDPAGDEPLPGDPGFGACGLANDGPGLDWQVTGGSVPVRAGHALVTAAGLWTIAGYDGDGDRADVWWSADGTGWTERTASAPFFARRWFGAAAHGGRIWVVAGNRGGGSLNLGDVWSSVDGSTWLESPDPGFPARHAPVLLSFDGYLWLVGGEGPNCQSRADVYRSVDGTNWQLVSANAGFGARDWHAAAVHDGRMWISGGVYRGIGCESDYLADVWSSHDGVQWQLEADGAFPARSGHAMVAAAGKLWVIGGTAAWPLPLYADVWVSDDGADWCQVTDDARFGARFDHAVAGTRDALWLIGGYDGAMRGDGWRSP